MNYGSVFAQCVFCVFIYMCWFLLAPIQIGISLLTTLNKFVTCEYNDFIAQICSPALVSIN